MRKIVSLLLIFALVQGLFGHVHEHEQEHEHESFNGNVHLTRVSPRSLHNFDTISARKSTRWSSTSNKRSAWDNNKQVQPYPDTLQLSLDAFDSTFEFDLHINEHLITKDTRVTIYGGHNDPVIKRTPEHKFYNGQASSNGKTGWARLTLLGSADNDFLSFYGSFSLGDEVYIVKKSDQFLKMKTEVKRNYKSYDRKRAADPDVDMVIYKRSDIEILDPEAEKCGVTGSHFDIMADFPTKSLFQQSQNVKTLLGERAIPSDCPSQTKVLYMGIASDCTYSAVFGNIPADIEEDVLSNWNLASAKFEQFFNVALGVIDIIIRTECGTNPPDPKGGVLNWNRDCSSGYTISNRLSDFSRWRGKQVTDAGLWHLMSKCSTGSTVGIAWLNMLCQTASFDQTVAGETEYVSGTGVSTVVDEQWIVIAHEIGHNFGAKHDCTSSCTSSGTSSCCACSGTSCDCNGKYIMNPTNGITTDDFSGCTQTLVCQRSSLTGSCLAEPGTRTVKNVGVCGNGVWEPPSEECDCGGEASCANDTCCFSNCTLKAGASCSDSNSACCQNCQNVTDTTIVCRAQDGECDVQETCDGLNAVCPKNEFILDGTTCGVNGSATYCATGQCTNRDLQCKTAAILNDNLSYDKACLDSCKVFCSSTIEGCRYFTGVFLNGTECGNNGKCYGGVCTEKDVVGTIIDFIRDNLVLFIVGVCIVGVLLLIFLAWGCRQAGRKNIGTQLKGIRAGVQATIRGRKRPQGQGGQRPSNAQPQGRPSNAQQQPKRYSQAQANRDPRASAVPREHARPASAASSSVVPAPYNPDFVPDGTFMEELPDYSQNR